MKLQDIFSGLASSEFSQLTIGGQLPGVINDHNYKLIIPHINLGMAALFRRFHVKESQLLVALQTGQDTYPLKSDYAVSKRGSHQAIKYIQDSVAFPFNDDIMKIVRVLTDTGMELSLNDVDDCFSVRTPGLTTLIVPKLIVSPTSATPDWFKTTHLKVVYRAAAPVIPVPDGLFEPSRVSIELPYTYLEALLYFVASRVNNPIGMTNEFHAGNNYAAKYEAACLDLMNTGIDVEQGGGNTRLSQKGFV